MRMLHEIQEEIRSVAAKRELFRGAIASLEEYNLRMTALDVADPLRSDSFANKKRAIHRENVAPALEACGWKGVDNCELALGFAQASIYRMDGLMDRLLEEFCAVQDAMKRFTGGGK